MYLTVRRNVYRTTLAASYNATGQNVRILTAYISVYSAKISWRHVIIWRLAMTGTVIYRLVLLRPNKFPAIFNKVCRSDQVLTFPPSQKS